MRNKTKWRNKKDTLSTTKHKKQETAILTGAMLAMGLAGPVQAEGLKPAVSAPNAKLELSGGSVEGDGTALLSGSGTVPLGKRFGFQLDGAVGEIDGHSTDGVAGHLFYRDPDSYMVGLTGLSLDYRSRDIHRIGIEAEKYYQNFTLGLNLGEQSGDLGTDAYYNLNYTHYYNDDLALKAELRGYGSVQRLHLGAEWQVRPSWALFADAGGGNGDEFVMVGVRLYLGKNKSLKLRHREDDPNSDIVKTAFETKRDSDKDDYVAPVTGGDGDGDGGDGGGDVVD